MYLKKLILTCEKQNDSEKNTLVLNQFCFWDKLGTHDTIVDLTSTIFHALENLTYETH